MATSLQLYKKSTFPPLLNIYQLPHCRNQNDKNPKKMMMKDDNGKKRNNKSSFSDEDKEDAMKRALLEQRHLENYKNLYRLRNAMYVRYRDLLNKKVQKQRIQIQMSDLNFKQNLEQQGRKKCIPGHQVPYCKLSHDAKYLKSIPQSSNYLIIGLQNELTRHGILKNQQDYEDFWTLILEGSHGSRLKEKLQDIKLKMVAAKSFPSRPVVRTGAAQSANVLLSNRCGQLKTSSASLPGSVSCQPPAHHPSKHTKAEGETEQIFPKLLLSWLSELQKRPEEQSRTQEVSKPCKRTRKHFHHDRHLIYLHHMYHLALLHMTSSKRLLEKNGQFAVAEKEHSVHDLMEYMFPSHHKQPGNSSTERGIEESTFPILLDRKQNEQCHRGFSKTCIIFKEMKNNSKEKQHENKGAVEILEDQKYNNSAFAPHEMITVPLTMEDVVLNNPVVEAKSTVTYWTNYVDKEESIF
ncbi:pre-mRNA 3' end processing protein WDR33 [Platysternon megacephalum]|uniref:Pre-mRNA 3' end processing protein WDR33 n=1 Tax=Platysternon megacephalum TaxID=55544 RepID=A0A4D9EIT4_9SAUR|nr:pre-mRNA 3' end processing protein WDR33 [Platysternon megacephalum]